ncbi:MAG: AraC family transcriptional regulator [Bacteroidales bacterium]|nr:AraC family transcriptional regulator [Bacteroidales bacterium]
MEPILYIGISQAFFAGLFIAVKKEQSTADKLLAVLLFLIAADMSFSLLKTKISFFTEIPPVLPLTFGPLVYLYVKSMIFEDYKFTYKSFFHFIPFISFAITTLIFIDKPIMPGKNFFYNDRFLPYRITYAASFFAVNTIYVIISFGLVFKHQKNIKNIFSYTSEKITLNWLKIVLFSFLFAYLIVYIIGAWYLIENKNFYVKNINPVDFSYIGLTFFAFSFSFFGFRQLSIYKTNEKIKSKTKYSNSKLKEAELNILTEKLNQIITHDKPYLNEKLTISELAEMMNISRHLLTQVINNNLNKNFYTFINEYRIEEVKKMFADPKKNHYSILGIAYECGFNSKSTFNTLFKKYTGITPSEYRKKVQNA